MRSGKSRSAGRRLRAPVLLVIALAGCSRPHPSGDTHTAPVPVTLAPSPSPEVARFIAERDACDHFRGEEPYDAARAAFLVRETRRLCTGTDRKLAALRRRFANDPAVTARLAGYEDRIE